MKKVSSISTAKPDSPLEAALANIPKTFRTRIIASYEELRRHHLAEAYKPLGMSAAHLAETVLRLLQNQVTGSYIPFGKSIGNFPEECRKIIESGNKAVPESLRLVVPRALAFLYTLRNKRGVGHVGGDVDANGIDGAALSRACDWVICELVRVYHGLSLEEAQDIVDGLAQRHLPDIWHVAGKKRVLRSGLTAKQQVLLLCYQEAAAAVLAESLCDWTDYSNLSVFKAKVLQPLHIERLVEYDKSSDTVTLSPKGVQLVENEILNSA